MSRPLRIGVSHLPVNFDMEQRAGFASDVGSDLFQSLYDQLTSPTPAVDATGTWRSDWHHLRPMLAEAWWYAADERSWTFRLRPGVRSAAGNEMTADDVLWGWQRAFALRDVGKWVARVSSVADYSDIEVLDRLTLRFHLSSRNQALPRTMAQCTPSIYDTAALERTADDPWALEQLASRPAGFGPYRLEHAGADATVLVANEHYWRGRPAITEVRLLPYQPIGAALEALRSGDVDLVPGVLLDQQGDLRWQENVRLTSADATPGLALHLDPSEAPFDDPLVRQAVACAVPYQEIIQTAYLGRARRWTSWVYPDSPGYADDVWPYPEDLPRARALLAASSQPAGFATRMVVRPADGSPIAAELIRTALGRIGIDVTTETAPAERAAPGTKANLGSLYLHGSSSPGRGNRVLDPLYALNHDFGPGRMRLIRYVYDNPALTEAMAEIADAGQEPAWQAATRKAQSILNADAVVVPICAYRYTVAHNRDLVGYRWYPDNCLSFVDLAWR